LPAFGLVLQALDEPGLIFRRERCLLPQPDRLGRIEGRLTAADHRLALAGPLAFPVRIFRFVERLRGSEHERQRRQRADQDETAVMHERTS
jgi:hypothetical protein